MRKIKRFLVLIFFLLPFFFANIALTARTPSEIPQTPAGKRLKESLDLINSGDMEKIRVYISTQFTKNFLKKFGEERLFDVYYGFFEKYRGLEFYKARESSSFKLVGIHRCRSTGSGYSFGLMVESKPPHNIQGMTILPLARPDGPESLESLNEEERVKMLDSFIARLGEAGVFSGTILLDKGGNVLFKAAYGFATRRYNIPIRIDTKLNLASLTKMFTAVAVAQLFEKGKVSFDDPIGKYLGTDWIPEKIGESVQIKHLLSHTSGIDIGGEDDNLTYLEQAFKGQFREISDYKSLSARATLKSRPGKNFSYSNIGMHLVGPIIEKISGETYFKYLQTHIFEPAGMSNTGFYELDIPEPNVAAGYSKEYRDGKIFWRNNILACQIKGTPAGGAYSTADDLLKFENALRNNVLVSEKTKEILFTPKKELNAPSYGYGFQVRTFDDKLQVGHSGGYVGINNQFSMYRNKGYTVIILSNVDLISGSTVPDIEFFILSLFF
jgi:CubicO group peptidase (beta-lactamase class C family)